MEIKNLKGRELLAQTEELVRNEKEFTLKILKNLVCIEQQRLYCDLGFGSLFSYLTKHLKYSEHEASNRIGSMQLLKKSPEVEKALGQGHLNLTQMSKINAHLKKDENKNQSLEKIIEDVSGKSTRKTEEILETLTPKKENLTPAGARQVVMKSIMVSQKTLEKIEEYRRIGEGKESDDELIFSLFSQKIVEIRSKKRTKEIPSPINKPSHYITQAVKDKILLRAGFQCENIGPITGKRCEEKKWTQFEHIKPVALGGLSSFENLKLLCGRCNQRQAIIIFGQGKMDSYLNPPKDPVLKR